MSAYDEARASNKKASASLDDVRADKSRMERKDPNIDTSKQNAALAKREWRKGQA